jgi:hypothetical protein
MPLCTAGGLILQRVLLLRTVLLRAPRLPPRLKTFSPRTDLQTSAVMSTVYLHNAGLNTEYNVCTDENQVWWGVGIFIARVYKYFSATTRYTNDLLHLKLQTRACWSRW